MEEQMKEKVQQSKSEITQDTTMQENISKESASQTSVQKMTSPKGNEKFYLIIGILCVIIAILGTLLGVQSCSDVGKSGDGAKQESDVKDNSTKKKDSDDDADSDSADNKKESDTDSANAENAEGESVSQQAGGQTSDEQKNDESGDKLDATLFHMEIALSNEWKGDATSQFVQYDMKFTNVSSEVIKDWTITIPFTTDVTLSQGWGGEVTVDGKNMTIVPVSYTAEVAAGATIEIGVIVSANGYAYPTEYTVATSSATETIAINYQVLKSDNDDGTTTDNQNQEQQETSVANNSQADNQQSANNQSQQSTGNQSQQSNNQSAQTQQISNQQSARSTDSQTTKKVNAVTGDFKKHGALSVKGTNIYDKNGKIFQIQGISTHGLSWFPQYVNKDAFKDMKNLGVNTIRLAMYTADYNGYCSGGNQEELKTLVNNGVEYASDLGMYVIIDWHILNDNNPNQNIDSAKAFFMEMSKKYASYDNVLYEICNEPNGGTAWDDGSDNDIKSYAETIIKTIRKKDKDAIIIVGTPNWCQDVDVVSQSPLDTSKYKNIVYALHFYAATHKDDIRNKMETAYNNGLPMLVSEFSICEASGNGYNDIDSANTWMQQLDNYGIGCVAWNLANKDESSSLLNSSCTKTSGFTEEDFSESGKWYLSALK